MCVPCRRCPSQRNGCPPVVRANGFNDDYGDDDIDNDDIDNDGEGEGEEGMDDRKVFLLLRRNVVLFFQRCFRPILNY